MRPLGKLREDFQSAVASQRGTLLSGLVPGRVSLKEGEWTDEEEQSYRYKAQSDEEGVLEWVTGWGFPAELGRAIAYEFDAWQLSVSDTYALCRDLQDMMTDEGFEDYGEAARELLRRIGGTGNIKSYIASMKSNYPNVPNLESRKPSRKSRRKLKEDYDYWGSPKKMKEKEAQVASLTTGDMYLVYFSTTLGEWTKTPLIWDGARQRYDTSQLPPPDCANPEEATVAGNATVEPLADFLRRMGESRSRRSKSRRKLKESEVTQCPTCGSSSVQDVREVTPRDATDWEPEHFSRIFYSGQRAHNPTLEFCSDCNDFFYLAGWNSEGVIIYNHVTRAEVEDSSSYEWNKKMAGMFGESRRPKARRKLV